MPPIALEKKELDKLFNAVVRSVVVLIRTKDGDTVDFGTGFVIYSDRRKILICVEKYLIKDDEKIRIRFYDNTCHDARVFMRKTLSRLAVLEVDNISRLCPRAVSFSDLDVTRQDIFTVAAVHKDGNLGLMTGTIGNPNCTAVDRLRNRAIGTEHKFAMSCHVAGPRRLPDRDTTEEVGEPKEIAQLVGAAVFDMSGLVIGTVDCADPYSRTLKFAIKASFSIIKLEKYLKEKDQKINLSRGNRSFNQITGMSMHHDTASGSRSKKRGRTNTPQGGTGIGKSLCMTPLDNMDVVSKEQLRLHTYPVQGDMQVVRREAIQRALMKLVTQESDDAWKSSSSSLADAGIEANGCIKVFIARNLEEVGSDKSIALEPFDLSHFFDGDGKIYGYKGLKISAWISAISFHVYADISFLETSNGGKGITDLKLALLNIFGENLVEKDEFLQTFSKECEYISDAVMNGHVIKHAASDDGNSAVEIVRVKLQGAADILYSRLVPLVLLLDEGSTIEDFKEHGWEMLMVVEMANHESLRPKFQLLGFAIAHHYCHYLESHLRISQILFLPPYQHEHHWHHLIEAIGSIAVSESVVDVTIEHHPDYLQHIDSIIDCLRLLNFDPIKPVLSATVSSLKATKLSEGTSHSLKMVPPADLAETVWLKLKINLNQCWETLIYLNLDAEDRESMDKVRGCIHDRVKDEILGRANGKKVAGSLNEGTWLACQAKEDHLAEDVMTLEEELNQLVDKNLKKIDKVAKSLASCSQGCSW